MLRKFLFLFLSALTLQGIAVPPLRMPLTHKQPDGKLLTLFRESAEDFIFYTTVDGIAILRDTKGVFCYAELSKDGLNPTANAAHDPDDRDEDERHYVNSSAVKADVAFNFLSRHATRRMPRKAFTPTGNNGLGVYGQTGPGLVSSIGEHRIPVLMIEFPDKSFQETTTPELVTRIFNEVGYTDTNGSVGSVRDYFLKMSREMYKPTFNVVGKVMLDSSYTHYGKDSGTSRDVNILALYAEALTKAFAQDIDFTPYIESDRGGVPLVVFYYAGQSEANSFDEGSENYIWPHFRGVSATFNGNDGTKIRFNSYFVGNETRYKYTRQSDGTIVRGEGPILDGQGVLVHEFSHALGLPDFYRTNGTDTTVRMGSRSVMDYGMYYKNGYVPVGYTAYERNVLGWEQLTELTEGGTHSLNSMANGGTESYIIFNERNRNEYYILENCQRDTYYPVGFGHGLFVMHIDYNARDWYYNQPNNDPSHLRMTYIPADDERTDKYSVSVQKEFKGDLFPGTSTVDSLTDNSIPLAEAFTGGTMRKPLYNISENEGIISFDYLLTPQLYVDRRNAIEAALQERTDVVFGLSSNDRAYAQECYQTATSYTDIFNLYNYIDDNRRQLTTGYYHLINAATDRALTADDDGTPRCATAEADATSTVGSVVYVLLTPNGKAAKLSAQGLTLQNLTAGAPPALGTADKVFTITRSTGSKATIASGALLGATTEGALTAIDATTTTTDETCWYLQPATEAHITMENIGDATACALYLPFPVTIPENAAAYFARQNTDGSISFRLVEGGIPAGIPFILISDKANDSITLSIPAETPDTPTDAGNLQGTYLPKTANILKLTWRDGLPAFLSATAMPANSAAFTAQ